MAKAFKEKEKEQIKSLLIEKGRELFSVFGLKKTSIGDLTKAVGIAQGSFYSFFGSKEELFFEIVELEHEGMQSKLLDESLIKGTITKSDFKRFILEAFELIDNNAILKKLLIQDEYELLLRKLPDEKLQAHIRDEEDRLLPMIKLWQEQGVMAKKEPNAITGLIRGIFTLCLHKREIGEKDYKSTIELLVELMADGLIIEGGKDND